MSRPDASATSDPPIQGLINYTLGFLATANNEALLGVFGLLVLFTYIILGRIGLLLIGVAVGVVLHASWEGSDQHTGETSQTNKSRRRKELALEVSSRLLEWPKRGIASDAQNEQEASLNEPEGRSSVGLEYTSFQPATADALKALTDAVIENYIKYWYEPILPSEPSFPGSCRRILTNFVTSVSWHLSRKRTEDIFLQFLTNSSSIVIVFLNELAAAFTAAAGATAPVEAQRAVEQYLEQCPDSSLANVLSDTQQKKKLSMIADDILSNYLDSKAYSCQPVRDFLREVFSGVVLNSVITSLARPEFINGWIIHLLEDGESEIMHAIDAGVEGARNQGVGAPKVPDEPIADTEDSVKLSSRQSTQAARDSEEAAILEVKRLSAMIASQPNLGLESDLSQQELDEDPTLPADRATKDICGSERSHDHDKITGAPSSNRPKRPNEDSTPLIILHGAQILVDDDGSSNDQGPIRSRPTWDYLLQVEPASTRSTGWMVFRKYSDFQSLHEMLETVSRLNLIQSFSERHPTLPPWKNKTRQALARELEHYLQDAMKHESLADNDRMRRFLEKDAGSSEATGPNKSGFSFPSPSAFENMGKGMLDALANAPKGVAGGGKAVFEGMTGVFGGATNNKKPASDQNNLKTIGSNRTSLSQTRSSLDDHSSPVHEIDDSVLLPGKPADWQSETSESPSAADNDKGSIRAEQDAWTTESSLSQTPLDLGVHTAKSMEPTKQSSTHRRSETLQSVDPPPKKKSTITADETQVAVELIFAVINELYTLSSAWNIRRTLLNAAKSYILRPGSPTLETIRALLQDSMIQSHTSDDALGGYLAKLRENALPTEDELKAWAPPPSEEEKLRTRETARNLFVQRGIPQALTSVMGAAASREALEKIFDSLQVETVARGFVFSVLLQGLRVLAL
ncbi:unnamed protein product [Penicillium olsonii]|nr:unnamed protein product [Penicillium olsonii]